MVDLDDAVYKVLCALENERDLIWQKAIEDYIKGIDSNVIMEMMDEEDAKRYTTTKHMIELIEEWDY